MTRPHHRSVAALPAVAGAAAAALLVAGCSSSSTAPSRKDVAQLSSDTPIVVFSHIPLFAMYPDWGWGTEDAAQALSYLKRFSSVTCLNGHVHQLFSKTEGHVTFYSGTTTAYPLPHPGDGPAPKPITLPAGKLHNALGIRQVSYTKGQQALALKEQTLS
jgi:hypothetical protein